MHAQLLRKVVRSRLDEPAGFARDWDEGTQREVRPFYDNQVTADKARMTEMNALRHGTQPQPAQSPMAGLGAAAAYDADLFRALIETVVCLALPQEVLARPGIRDKIENLSTAEPLVIPGPSRDRLLQLLSA
jgi:hypothetical protein